MMAAEDDGIIDVRAIENREFMRPIMSSTFHGRDVFAPIAAYISLGLDVSLLGPRVTDPIKLQGITSRISRGFASSVIVYIDHFGNAYTGIKEGDLGVLGLKYGDELRVNIPRKNIELKVRFLRSYAMPMRVRRWFSLIVKASWNSRLIGGTLPRGLVLRRVMRSLFLLLNEHVM